MSRFPKPLRVHVALQHQNCTALRTESFRDVALSPKPLHWDTGTGRQCPLSIQSGQKVLALGQRILVSELRFVQKNGAPVGALGCAPECRAD